MSLEITGKLIAKLPLKSGTSKTGNSWQKQEFVIETMEQYPRKICANLWGDKIDLLNAMNINDTVKMSFDLESREYNGNWYTDVKAWKLEPAQMQGAMVNPMGAPVVTDPYAGAPQYAAAAPVPPAMPAAPAATNVPPMEDPIGTFSDNSTDDLPF